MGISCLLVVDRRFVESNGTILTEGPQGPETGSRYLNWFESVTVAGRQGTLTSLNPAGLSRVDAKGLEFVFLPDISGIVKRLRHLATARRQLRRLIAEADAVIVRMPTALGLEAAALALEARKPIAMDLGGCILDDLLAHGSLRGKVYAPYAYRRVRSIVKKMSWVSYVTQSFLQSRYPAAKDAHTVACSNVELPETSVHVLEKRFARINDRSTLLTFGTIGSLHGRFKGIQHALPALKMARDTLPTFQYRILGGGNTKPWKRLARRHGLDNLVHFDGTLPAGESVMAWLDGIDIYLHPSLREGLPRAIVEAMSRGCTVVASDVAGTPELLPRSALHRPGNVRELCEIIMQKTDRNTMCNSAERNWIISQNYSAQILGVKRDMFWSAFSNYASQQKMLTGGSWDKQ